MDPAVWAGALVAAIGAMAGTITLLYKTVVAAKDQLVTTKDEQLKYREAIIAAKDVQIAALQIALKEKDDRLDKSIDTIGDAVRMLEAGPQLPPQTQTQRRVGGSGR